MALQTKKAKEPPPSLILDNHLYLSDVNVASNRETVEEFKIDVIVNVSREAYEVPPSTCYNQFHLDDDERAQIEKVFNPVFAIIDAALADNKRVLVHCRAGVSRSATVVIAYLMHAKKWTLMQALLHVRLRRPIICPNRGFLKKLVDLDVALYGRRSFDIDDYYVDVLVDQGFDGETCRRALMESHGDVDVALFKLVRQRRMEGVC